MKLLIILKNSRKCKWYLKLIKGEILFIGMKGQGVLISRGLIGGTLKLLFWRKRII